MVSRTSSGISGRISWSINTIGEFVAPRGVHAIINFFPNVP